MKTEYTIKELADKLNVSTRTVERYLKSLYTKKNNKIMVPLDVVELLELRHNSDTTPTEIRQEYDVIEGFTNSEYSEFHRRLTEYPLLKNDLEHQKKHAENHEDHIKTLRNELEYHKKSAESHNRQMEIILNTLQQRNFIEAKEKGLDDE